MLTFFVWRGLLGKSVINFSIFRNRNFVFSCCNVFIFTFVLTAMMAYFPTMLQEIYGYPVNLAGYATVSRGMIALFTAPFIPLIVRRIGSPMVIFSGCVGISCSCLLLSQLSLSMNSEHLFFIMGLQGASMMAFFIPLIDICFIGFVEKEQQDASGIFNFFRNVSCSVGAPFFATVLTQKSQLNYHNLGQHLSVFSDGLSSIDQNVSNLSDTFRELALHSQLLYQSLFLSYLNVYYLLSIILFSFMWLPFFLKESR
jgi:DHA2 family multidrug resistance protein